jgi:hypothetical protein
MAPISSRQKAGDGPSRVTLSGGEIVSPPAHPRPYAASGVIAIELAAKLPDLSGWYASLRRIPRPVLYQRRVERWDGRAWVRYYDLIEDDTGYRGASGLYRIRRSDSVSFVAHFDSDTQTWVRGDFCGLRYFDRQRQGTAGCFVLDEDNLLFLPWDCRWPVHYEKALVLATGELPSRQDEFLRYEGVPAGLARTLASKLHCSVRTDFNA